MDNDIKKYLREIEKAIGEKIAQLRILFNISQKELAKVINVSLNQLYKYENGKNRISIGRLSLIAKKFNKDLNYFIDKKR